MTYKKIYIELFLFFLLIVLILPTQSFTYDMTCWKNWASVIQEKGLGSAYLSDTNYPPLIMYFLSFYNFILALLKIEPNINYIKVIPFIFDLLPIIILVLARKNYDLKKGYYFFLLFNIAYLYNSVVWGQVDSIHSNLGLTAIFISLRYPATAVILFVLALNMKLQAIIFFPILLVCLATSFSSYKQFLKSFLAGLSIQILLLIPFFLTHTLDRVWHVVIHSAGFHPFTSLNAFNVWYLLLDGNPFATSDSTLFHSVSYKVIGFTSFVIVSALTLLPLCVKTMRVIISKIRPKNYQELVFLTTGIIVLVFFFFNTEMHERYSHPALIFLFFYSIYRRNFILYILVSIAYLLNIEYVLRYYKLPHPTFIFNPTFIASLFLLIMVSGLILIYRNYDLKKDWQFLKGFLKRRRA